MRLNRNNFALMLALCAPLVHPGVIHRANDGKHDYYVYYRGRKISFG
jgi:hypothetical protein